MDTDMDQTSIFCAVLLAVLSSGIGIFQSVVETFDMGKV
jgi:hypothetical protein